MLLARMRHPSLGVAYLAAGLREAGHEVSIIDVLGEALEKYTPIRGFPKAIKHGLGIEEIFDRIPAGINLIGVSCMFSLEWPYFLGSVFYCIPSG
jgi:anaerobic magnesium-protoporphyrin IX monomethyl ester cyclase